MDTTGGRVTLEIGGTTVSVRASGNVDSSTVSRENGANRNGKGYSTIKSKLAKLDVTFDRGETFLWDEAMMLENPDVTFHEFDVGVLHVFTAAAWSGSPTINTETGEVTGLSLESDQYSPQRA